MNRTTWKIVSLATALLIVAPAASALMVSSAWRDPPGAYVATGILHAGSAAQSLRCQTPFALATAALAERAGGNWTLAFEVTSACGPFADEGPGTRDADGVIRGTGAAGTSWEVRELSFRAGEFDGSEAGLVTFHLVVRTAVDVGPDVALAASGWLSGVGADADAP